MTNEIITRAVEQEAKREYRVLKLNRGGWGLLLAGFTFVAIRISSSGSLVHGFEPLFLLLLFFGVSIVVQCRTVKALKQYIDVLESDLTAFKKPE